MNRLRLVVSLVMLFLTACAPGATPTPTATPMPTATPTVAPTATNTPTPEPTSTPTATPMPVYTLSGTVFFDYNGSGIQDEGEPPIEGAEIGLRKHRRNPGEEKLELSVVTNGVGEYLFTDLPADDYLIGITSSDENDPAQAFRYVSLSLEEFQPIEEVLRVAIDGDTRRDLGLMQGFLTVPLRCGDIDNAPLVSYFDLQPGPGVRNYLGDVTVASWHPLVCGTLEDHFGIDWGASEGTPIVASAPGIANYAGEVETAGYGMSLHVTLEHKVAIRPDWLTKTVYGHLSEILVSFGQQVSRGQVIGLSGSTGSSEPHLHWGLLIEKWNPTHVIEDMDPFRDLFGSDSKSFWTKDNNPQCLP